MPCEEPAVNSILAMFASAQYLYTVLCYPLHRIYKRVVCRGKTNFFEKRVGDYQKSGVMSGLTNTNQHAIAFDEDF